MRAHLPKLYGRAILNHHGVRTDNATVADGDGTPNFRPRRDIDVAPDTGNLAVARLPADGYIHANYTILANDGALVHDGADTLVVEHRALANLGARRDEQVVCLVDTQLIEARQQLKAVIIEPVRTSILVYGVKSLH